MVFGFAGRRLVDLANLPVNDLLEDLAHAGAKQGPTLSVKVVIASADALRLARIHVVIQGQIVHRVIVQRRRAGVNGVSGILGA